MMRMKICFVMCGLACLVACSGTARNVLPGIVYDFGLPAAAVAESVPGSGLVLEVRSPPWFDSLGIDYRLAYDDSNKPREYATGRWAANPGVLLVQRWRQQLGLGGSMGVRHHCRLHVDLQEFSQVFDSPQSSHAVLLAGVSLIDSRGQLVAERRFDVEKMANTPDMPGGVAALVSAGTDLGHQMAVWLNDLFQAGARAVCHPPQ